MKKMPDSTAQRRILILFFVIALAVRSSILIWIWDPALMAGISTESIDIAENLAAGRGFVSTTLDGFEPNYHELPGYSLFMSVPIYLFGTKAGLFISQIIQIIMSAAGVFLIFSITRMLFGPTAGLSSAFLWATAIPEAHLSTYLLHDAPMAILALTAIYFFIRALHESTRKSWRYIIFCAITIGLTSYIRSDLLLAPIFLFLAFLVWEKTQWKLHIQRLAVMGAVIFLTLLPWGIRNYLHFNQFILTRTVLWQSVWEGFGEFKNPFGAVLDDATTQRQVDEEYGNFEAMSDAEFQEILKKKTLTAVRTHPAWYLTMLPKRFAKMVGIGGYGFWNNFFSPDPYYSYSASYKLLHPDGGPIGYISFLSSNFYELLSRIAQPLYKLLILIFASAGIVLWRKEWKKILVIVSIYAYGIFSHLPIYWEPRYLIPTEFPLLILAALCIARFIKKSDTISTNA